MEEAVLAQAIEIHVPDIGTPESVDVIEVLVKPGDRINQDDSLVTLESDKASMEIPSPQSGVVASIKVKVGDKIAEGGLILTLNAEAEADAGADEVPETATSGAAPAPKNNTAAAAPTEVASVPVAAPVSTASTTETVLVPDIGTTDSVDVIEVLVKPGDSISKDDSLITLESDKASMDIPSPFSGEVIAIDVKVGDKIAQGGVILSLKTSANAAPAATQLAAANQNPIAATPTATTNKPAVATATATQQSVAVGEAVIPDSVYAGPAVRRLAREWGVDLSQVKGSGRKGRIVKEDLQGFTKERLKQPAASQGNALGLAPAPVVDFAKFGEVTTQPLNKIKKLTGQNLHRNWVTIPHVTQFDEADITEMEAFRKANKDAAAKKGIRLTPLAFIVKAAVVALKEFPSFNASLDATGENLIIKHYYHIGVAVDTPNGLVVPVIRDADKKGVIEIAEELALVSEKARNKKLMPADMQGSCFSISSLGGIGGTAFTPIVNAPDVAILGVSKAQMKPIYDNGEFVPRLMLPLSMSYDHRVIDGAEGARFTKVLSACLSDLRRILL